MSHGEDEFRCEGCGAMSAEPNHTTDGVNLCRPCYDEVPREPVAVCDQPFPPCKTCRGAGTIIVRASSLHDPEWPGPIRADCPDCVLAPPAEIDRYRPHLQGPARCVGCGTTWRAVLPATADPQGLECPACHQMTGRLEP